MTPFPPVSLHSVWAQDVAVLLQCSLGCTESACISEEPKHSLLVTHSCVPGPYRGMEKLSQDGGKMLPAEKPSLGVRRYQVHLWGEK